MAIRYTHKEEVWNSWSHAGGAIMAGAVGIAFFIVVLLGNNDRSWAAIGVGLYLFGMLENISESGTMQPSIGT